MSSNYSSPPMQMSFDYSLPPKDNTSKLNRQDSMHIGGGIPTLLACFSFDDDQHEARYSSSMFSAASTVASAFSSIEDSNSSSETNLAAVSFNQATSLAKQLSESCAACRRACEVHKPARTCNRNRSHPYEKSSEKPKESKSADRISDVIFRNELTLLDKQVSSFEEFSLGSGNP